MGDTLRYPKDAPIRVDNEPFVNASGIKNTTATGVLIIRRTPDFLYFDGADWIADPTQLTMTEIDDINSPGSWFFDFLNGLDQAEYVVEIIDTSGGSANSPQIGKMIVDDKLMRQSEAAAAGAVGKAVYDPITSLTTLYSFENPSVVIGVFLKLDEDGQPAGNNAFFQKVPQ